jgi:hypothetical protein
VDKPININHNLNIKNITITNSSIHKQITIGLGLTAVNTYIILINPKTRPYAPAMALGVLAAGAVGWWRSGVRGEAERRIVDAIAADGAATRKRFDDIEEARQRRLRERVYAAVAAVADRSTVMIDPQARDSAEG